MSPNAAASKMSSSGTCAFTACVSARSNRYRARINAETPFASRAVASEASCSSSACTPSRSSASIAANRPLEVLAIDTSSH